MVLAHCTHHTASPYHTHTQFLLLLPQHAGPSSHHAHPTGWCVLLFAACRRSRLMLARLMPHGRRRLTQPTPVTAAVVAHNLRRLRVRAPSPHLRSAQVRMCLAVCCRLLRTINILADDHQCLGTAWVRYCVSWVAATVMPCWWDTCIRAACRLTSNPQCAVSGCDWRQNSVSADLAACLQADVASHVFHSGVHQTSFLEVWWAAHIWYIWSH